MTAPTVTATTTRTHADAVTVLGIRHHGPGSARALATALADLQPDIILVEGPPEADDLVALAKSPELKPPVALLAYRTKAPTASEGDGDVDRAQSASFWPFAIFSPEWQAIRYATDHGIPLRFCDLPATHVFGLRDGGRTTRPPIDPIGALAQAAGYDDAERWWEDVIEHRRDGVPPFAAIAEAMSAVRTAADADMAAAAEAARAADSADVAEADVAGVADGPDYDEIREAWMRSAVRAARKDGYARIAVVCGAWHVPALVDPAPTAASDARLMRGLPKVPVAMTWVPWTHGRLASATGYGAGVTSPGWYHHIFTAPDRVVERWLVAVANVLRAKDLPVSSAHVIEATRLAEALAVLRGRPAAGLSEITEATRAVLCDGDEVRLDLVTRELVVGDRLGCVPADTPAVPLAADLAASQRRLKLPPEALARDLDLDLRKPVDIERSRLLHRLLVLGIGWGRPADAARRGKGTFWESWTLEWAPELAVDVIAAGAYGTTVAEAASTRAAESARQAPTLAEVTGLVERCLLADLPGALGEVLAALDAKVALDADVAHLMDSVPPLARSTRYGDVRGTDTAALGDVLAGLVTRICVGLPVALAGLDDAAAATMRELIDKTQAALQLLDDQPELRSAWIETLDGIAARDDLHGLITGRLCRLLRDEQRLSSEAVEMRMARTVSIGTPPATAAAWIEGFLSGGGLLLVHDPSLLRLVDAWLGAIPADAFTDALPLLRRTFSTFPAPERRAIGERARNIRTADEQISDERCGDLDGYDYERAMRLVPVLQSIMGLKGDGA